MLQVVSGQYDSAAPTLVLLLTLGQISEATPCTAMPNRNSARTIAVMMHSIDSGSFRHKPMYFMPLCYVNSVRLPKRQEISLTESSWKPILSPTHLSRLCTEKCMRILGKYDFFQGVLA